MEIASLAGVVLGIMLAYSFHPQLTEYLKSFFPSFDIFVLHLISFTAIFAVVLIFCNLIGWALKSLLKKASLGWTDRVLGIGLAVLKGIIIAYLAIVIITFVSSLSPFVAKSRLAPLIVSSYQAVVKIVSPSFYKDFNRKFTGQKNNKNVVRKKIEDASKKDGL